MTATDFIFDGKRASDYGLMLVSINSNDDNVASGGDMEYSVAKTPNNDRFTFYGNQFNNVLTWNISVIKNPCQYEDATITACEESEIAKWLIKTDGYKWFQFCQEGYENIYYNVYINMTPNQIAGTTIGFDLTVTSDCAYGFSNIITKQATINASTPYHFYVDNSINNYILPKITIQGNILWKESISYKDMLSDNNILKKYDISPSNAFASSTLLENAYMPSEAFDLNTTSMWGSQGPPDNTEHIGIHLTKLCNISAFAVAWDANYAQKLMFQISDNGLDWTTVQIFHNILSDFSTGTLYTLNSPVKTQYARIVLQNPNIQERYLIKEIAFFESNSGFENDFYIYNANDLEQNINNDKACEFTHIDYANIIMDSENEIINGVNPNQFNWYFLRLVNGKNTIVTNSESDINIKMEYREIRRAMA